ncbi:hypothetical protein SAMN02745163_00051 [Clostridium cavendishii DSM 21758]|uniref:Uncharacterized protein n=1 Tax=Clostridium cavendishii DSM 21758 TaxID=1121302 RepID=A0A1M6ADE6_9CLOT|nr:hypothetical protein [Clostridium cavendishii]SHI34338.1 hypothetical protein SAMN02745163_00051 [Clostridium cavendishii DSM 21758]
MSQSHIDSEKLNRLSKGQYFEYRDVVEDNLPTTQHSQDGAVFKQEVQNNVFNNIIVNGQEGTHTIYQKI